MPVSATCINRSKLLKTRHALKAHQTRKMLSEPVVRKKLVIVGDGACGKTSLLMYLPSIHHMDSVDNSVFKKGMFPEQHAPTVFDTYVQDIYLPPDNKHIQ